MATSTRETTARPVVLSLGMGFVALSLSFLTGLDIIWKSLFTLVPPSTLAWGFWVAVCMTLLSFAGMMATLFVLDDELEGVQ